MQKPGIRGQVAEQRSWEQGMTIVAGNITVKAGGTAILKRILRNQTLEIRALIHGIVGREAVRRMFQSTDQGGSS
uniref:Uncharacterized protein n=1 Tax=Arundo donax TaxID=35708 RepID=A0A0A8Z5Z4_ARUDO